MGNDDVASHGYDIDGRRIWSKDANGQVRILLGELFEYNQGNQRSISFVYAFGELLGTREVTYSVLRTAPPSPGLDRVPELRSSRPGPWASSPSACSAGSRFGPASRLGSGSAR